MTTAQSPTVYQLKIELQYTQPLIWRRVLVPAEFTLLDLHAVIQAVMAWDNSHLHLFEISQVRYSPNMPEPLEDSEEEERVTLAEAAPREKLRFTYDYDFGDSWRHQITVEKILPVEEGKPYPLCLAGAQAAPTDDIGGVPGYYMRLEALRDPKHPDHEEAVDWLGEDFDPTHFSVEETNAKLAWIQQAWRRLLAAEKAGTEATVEDALVSLKVPKALRPRAAEIMTLTDQFAAAHLDQDYVPIVRRLLAALARKRPSPLLQGEPPEWAAAALSVVLSLNLVFDPDRHPLFSEGRLLRHFGVSADRAMELGQLSESTSLTPLDLILPRYEQPFEDLSLWLMDVEAGFADPLAPPPDLQPILARMHYLQELEEAQAREEQSHSGPNLRLLTSPPEEEEE